MIALPVIALPGVCQGCRKPVIWNGTRWRTRGSDRRHVCLMAVICGTLMPQLRERCARRIGHLEEHRSRYSLDNAAEARRKWRPSRARVA